jgi:hypothetical protein
MKSLYIINRPLPNPRAAYDEAIENITNKLSTVEGVKAIYRFGNITTPGISDIDLLVVFKNKAKCNLNGFEDLPKKYFDLFTHGIIALSEDHFGWNNYYSVWSERHLLWGEHPDESSIPTKTVEEDRLLKHQTAIEFLLMNYIDLSVQLEYGVIKLRSLLQHLKGFRYDLEFLDIHDSWMHPMLAQLNHWILHWFEQTPSDKELVQFIHNFMKAYSPFVNELIQKEPIYLPKRNIYFVAKNMQLIPYETMGYTRKGIVLPSSLSLLFGSKYYKLQNKLNQFYFNVPMRTGTETPFIVDRFNFFSEMKNYNMQYLPNFTTLTTSITAKLI